MRPKSSNSWSFAAAMAIMALYFLAGLWAGLSR
jgi:hypothetical protein